MNIKYSFGGLIPALETGKVDVLTGLTPTDERKKFVDFSDKDYVGTANCHSR